MSGAQEVTTCGPPCCGGERCTVSAQNRVKSEVCPPGSPFCKPCRSGRACLPEGCGVNLSPGRRLLLRLARGTLQRQNLPLTSQVCVRRSATSEGGVCTPYAHAADMPDAIAAIGNTTRLEVTTADLLLGGGLDIWIQSAEGLSLAYLGGVAHRPDIHVTALCRGLRFANEHAAAPGPVQAEVFFYLDDP